MSAPPSSPKQKPPLWAHLVGTFFYIGHLRPGPGTWASVATLILWWFGIRLVPPQSRTLATAIAAVLVTLIGIPAATRVARAWNKKDPSQVVIDEVAGQLVTLVACPVALASTANVNIPTWKPALAALILFRAFDILKPPPVRQLEALPEGTGIMLDDIGAGIYGWIVLHVLLHYGFLG
jgi:phosphatidylglycerophosphatase A